MMNRSAGVDGTDVNYVSFGKGNYVLITFPGLGEELTTEKGMALASHFIMFSHSNQLVDIRIIL